MIQQMAVACSFSVAFVCFSLNRRFSLARVRRMQERTLPGCRLQFSARTFFTFAMC